jgi:hypothetical protein
MFQINLQKSNEKKNKTSCLFSPMKSIESKKVLSYYYSFVLITNKPKPKKKKKITKDLFSHIHIDNKKFSILFFFIMNICQYLVFQI